MIKNLTSRVSVLNIERLVFYLFIFCIPFQTRLILANWAPARIGFNEWTSVFLQATDILIVGLLVLWFLRYLQGDSKFKFNKIDIALGLFFVISLISISQSHFRGLSFYQLVKLVEFILFYLYVRSNLGKVIDWSMMLEVFFVSGFFQAVIGIIQYVQQSAIGLRLLGESPIAPGVPGVASFPIGNELVMRAYGTFPHPNILAGFLMFSIFSFYSLYFNKWNTRRGFTMLFLYGVMLYAFFLTYSRTVIFFVFLALGLLLIASLIKYGKKLFNKKFFILVGISFAVVLLFSYLNLPEITSRLTLSGEDDAVAMRIFYNKVASEATGARPWLGEGIGTFVPNMMQDLNKIPVYFYQPVHNIYLLISSEVGILGLASFLLYLILVLKNYIKNNNLKDLNKLGLLLVFLVMFSVGLLDHFPWTIQQGRILLWLSLAFLL